MRAKDKRFASLNTQHSIGSTSLHLLPAFTPESFWGLAYGKLYPVTAAQLLRVHTGFLAPIHFSKLAKN
jgi:hypothetical protein